MSSLLAVGLAVSLSRFHDDLPKSIMLWLVFVVASGALIDRGSFGSWRRALIYSIFPALSLFLASTSMLILSSQFFKGSFSPSSGGGKISGELFTQYASLYAAVSLATVIGITTGCLASQSLFNSIKSLNGLPLQSLQDMKTKVTTIITILALITAVFLVGF